MNDTQIKGKQPIINNNNIEQYVKSENEKTIYTLEKGKYASTLVPGKLYPIAFKEVLAGEYIVNWDINNLVRLLTPLVPTFDRSYINIQAHFVPHTRVWKSAEKALAGTDKTGSKNLLPTMTLPATMMQYSTFNRMVISRYGIPNNAAATKINVLLVRGYRAIVNDYIMNKDYGTRQIEWNDDVVTTTESNNIIGYTANSLSLISGNTQDSIYDIENAPTRKGYLTNIKKQVSIDPNELDNSDTTSTTQHLDWQTRFMDAKQKADNINKNDWDIIAELGGTQPVKTDRVEFLGQVDYELNYQQITQSSPEFDGSSPLGTTGSFSFTKATGTLFSHKKFLQHGFIHITVSVNIDNYFENGTPKELLKENANEIYRPGLAKKEVQLLYQPEVRNFTGGSKVGIAFQPAWAEYKRLPSFVSGQMQTQLLTKVTGDTQYTAVSNSQWHNFKAIATLPVISDTGYFRDQLGVASVFKRNNILVTTPGSNEWDIEPFICMNEHIVTTQLPIESSVIKQVSKAEVTR